VVIRRQAPAGGGGAPRRFLGNAERHLGTAGASQSFAAAPPGGDKLHRLMTQAHGMIQPKADDRKGQ